MDAATLRAAMLDRISLDLARAMLPHYNAALLAANCTTVNRSAMLAAQLGHESASLRYMEEIASGAAYEGRKDLGNTQPGDGRRYKGRGPIQLTGRTNYGAFSRWCHSRGLVTSPTYFVDRPLEVAQPRWGFLAASWYWVAARPKINGYCDAGDITAVTRAINGGTNGIADRRMRWDHCRRLGDRLLPAAPTRPVEDDVSLTPAQDRMLREVHQQLLGPWDSWADPNRKHTLVDLTRQVEAAETRALDHRGHHGAPNDNQYGHVLSIRKEVAALAGDLLGLERKLDAILTQLAKP